MTTAQIQDKYKALDIRLTELELSNPKLGGDENILSNNADKLKDGKVQGVKGKYFVGFITSQFRKIGTGFIVFYEGKYYLITASHNVIWADTGKQRSNLRFCCGQNGYRIDPNSEEYYWYGEITYVLYPERASMLTSVLAKYGH